MLSLTNAGNDGQFFQFRAGGLVGNAVGVGGGCVGVSAIVCVGISKGILVAVWVGIMVGKGVRVVISPTLVSSKA